MHFELLKDNVLLTPYGIFQDGNTDFGNGS